MTMGSWINACATGHWVIVTGRHDPGTLARRRSVQRPGGEPVMSRGISHLARGPALVAVLTLALALGGVAVAQFTGDDFVLGPGGPTGGGGNSAGGGYELFGSIGQPLAGSASGGEFVLGGGVAPSGCRWRRAVTAR
ncbi:MAG: hypothetical protein U5Q44_12550 [Dehalococcoidia bacterium]|nr:hypothetical protein [Dehalococcoidia bacterium]